MQERLSATAATDDAESSRHLAQLLWDRFFQTSESHCAFWGGQHQEKTSPAPVLAPRSNASSSRQDGVFRHHAQLLAFSYYFQDSQFRRAVLISHLGLVRKLGAVFVARSGAGAGVSGADSTVTPASSSPTSETEDLHVLLAQCMALAEFMLRTLHDSERTSSQAARLRSDIARVPTVPAVGCGSSGVSSGSSRVRAGDHRSRYLAVFEADEETGVTAWHERPGAARAYSRDLCSDVSVGGYAGWREAWEEVLEAATRSGFKDGGKDAGHLFFCAWRLLGTLPPEYAALGEGGGDALADGAAHLEPGVVSICRIRACLLGLQDRQQQARGDASGVGDWGLLSSRFLATLSMVRTGLPSWLQVGSEDLAQALVPAGVARSGAQNELLARQYCVHGLVEAFAVYASAAIAKAGQQEYGLVGAMASPAAEDQDRSSEKHNAVGSGDAPLVEISRFIVELAEKCFQYYVEVIRAALAALHTVGNTPESANSNLEWAGGSSDVTDEMDVGGSGGTFGGGGVGDVREACHGGIPSELLASIALLINWHSTSKPMSRLAKLGCDQYLAGGLHTELNYPSVEGVLEKLPLWHRRACSHSTSRGSQSAGKLPVAFAEPDVIGSEFGLRGSREISTGGTRGRSTDAIRKWEVMVNVAVWSTARSLQEMDAADSSDKATAPVPPGGSGVGATDMAPGQDVDDVAECAAKLCLSARSMLEAVLLSMLALTNALASSGTRDGSKRGALPDNSMTLTARDVREDASEAWDATSKRAVLLWGEMSANVWCQWFKPLPARAFGHLVRPSGSTRDSGSPANAKLWNMVTGAWQVRRADSLIRLALANSTGGDSQHVSGTGNTISPTEPSACAQVALEDGLDQLLLLLAVPSTARDVLRFYDNGSGSTGAHEKIVKAVAAAMPCCPRTSGAEKETAVGNSGSAIEEPMSPTSGAVLGEEHLVPRGDASTFMVLLERPEFSNSLSKLLLVLRTALEAEANACTSSSSASSSPEDNQHHHPLASAIACTFASRPEAVIHNLVTWAVVGPRSNSASASKAQATDDALAVLGIAVGYPGAVGVTGAMESAQQGNLRKRVFHGLLHTASSWAGRRSLIASLSSSGSSSSNNRKKAIASGGGGSISKGSVSEGTVVDAASLSLWLASMEGLYAELAVALMGVARPLSRRLRGTASTDRMQVDEGEVEDEAPGEQEETGEEETAWSLARCLELMLMIFTPAVGSEALEEQHDADSEDDDSVLDLAEWASAPVGGKSLGSGATSVTASKATAVATSSQQEPPLVCTFVSSHKQFVNQHWYHCYTCGLVHDKGCCRLCVRLCHRGHDVSYARLSCFFCDCGSSAAEGGGDTETPPPSLENSPASSEGLSGSSPSAGAAGGGSLTRTSTTKDGSRVKCECLKMRTRRELDALLSNVTPGTKPTSPSGRSHSGSGRASSSRRQNGSKKSSRSSRSPSQRAVLRAKTTAAAAAAAASKWRDSPAQTASILAALSGGAAAEGGVGILEDLRAAYSVLLSKFDGMNARGAAKVGGTDGDNGSSNSVSGSNKRARQRPWDALCDSSTGGADATSGGNEIATSSSPSRRIAAGFLRCRPAVDTRTAALYPVLAPARLMRNGSLDVRLPADGARARQDRAAMALHGVVRRNLAATSCGRVAVAEAQSVLVVDPVGALALRYAAPAAAAASAGTAGSGSSSRSTSSVFSVADSPVDRSHLCVVSSMAVGFDVVGLSFNRMNERHLVAWGLRNCCVVVLNSRGVALRRVQVRHDVVVGVRFVRSLQQVHFCDVGGDGCVEH